jgi:hypothetical protein
MKRITTALTHRIIVTAIKCSWAIQTAGARKQALGARLAVQRDCDDDVLATITTKTIHGR